MQTFLIIYATILILNIVVIEVVILTPMVINVIKRMRERDKAMMKSGNYIILPSNF